jgi:hypothetical protein
MAWRHHSTKISNYLQRAELWGGIRLHLPESILSILKNFTTCGLTAALSQSWSGLDLGCYQLNLVTLNHFTPQILSNLLSAPYKVYFFSLKLFFPCKPSSTPWCWYFNRVDLGTLCGASSHNFILLGTTGSRSGAPPSNRQARRRRGLRDCHTLSRVNTVWLKQTKTSFSCHTIPFLSLPFSS